MRLPLQIVAGAGILLLLSACNYVPGLKPIPTVHRVEFLTSTPTAPTLSREYDSKVTGYFFDIAIGSEYGRSPAVIHKWTSDVRIRVHGNPTAADLDELEYVVYELNGLVAGITVSTTKRNPNIEIHFVPESKFRTIERNYRPTNLGFFWLHWDESDAITSAKILIASEGITQEERSHLIREELTQSLGLMRDSNRYSDSIFYQGWTSTTEYTPIDRAVVSLLYEPQLLPGMTPKEVRSALAAASFAH